MWNPQEIVKIVVHDSDRFATSNQTADQWLAEEGRGRTMRTEYLRI
jgi:hypothetical protein